MKNTPFTKFHLKAGAKMLPFAGFNMPIEYSGITNEHLCVRNGVGVFDVSHMGEIWVKGEKALDFLQKVTSNNVAKLKIGQAQYSCLTNHAGGIVDDLLVYFFESNKYMLVVNASNIEKDYNWLVLQNDKQVVLENASDNMAQLAIQGPLAIKTLQKLTRIDLSAISYYTFVIGQIAGIDEVIISATGYTGAGGFELYFHNEHAETIWKAIFEAGEEFGIKPIGLGARDTLRLEMGFCLYGNDINDDTSPIEAGLGWITKFSDDKEFIGKDIMLKMKVKGLTKQLRGFKMLERGIPRHDYEIVDESGNIIGTVSSGTISPVLGIGIGMGYVQNDYTKLGTNIYIKIRNKNVKAEVVKMPFI